MFRESCRRYAKKTALQIPTSDGYTDVSYAQYETNVRGYAAVLKELGLERGDRLALQCENCPEWAYLDWACQSLGVVFVPIYPTLPYDQAQYIATDCGAKVVVAGNAEQAEKTKALPSVVHLLLKGSPESIAERAAKLEMPVAEWDAAIDAVDPEDLATIIYTSGTTGNPKGAMLAHKSPTWLCRQVTASLPVDYNDKFFSYLPLAHIFERLAGHFLPVSCGATIAYAKSLASLANDIQAARPTILLCVPRFLEAMMDRIKDGVTKAPPWRQKLFHAMLGQGKARDKGKFAPLAGPLDMIVGKKIRERLGGRIRFLVSGGAALAPHVAEFYSAFGFSLLQGYGLTETTAASCLNPPWESKYWTVGPPIQGVEIIIAEDGEILIKAPSVMMGYYNLPEETSKAIDSDGWFHTGDIGEWDGKHLKITDRKKDILVLANGKNIAPQPIENKLKESAFIGEAVLFGDGNEFVFALVIPNFDHLKKHVDELGIKPPSDEELLKHDAVKALIKAEIDKVNKTLADFEKVKKHLLINATFSVESGELTPSMKVKRKVIKERFAAEIATMTR